MKRLILWVFILCSAGACGQEIEEGYYRAPMDIPLYLAGNFAEMRSNHFHSGVDFKTQGREGIPALAVADGYVSRIKVSPFGYGNALYINHPNGTTSVYAHLKFLADTLADYLKKAQYDLESFEVDLYPEPGSLPVKKGQRVGDSGNSGSSGGPHLHFEIRNTATEYPLNPLLYGFAVKDFVKPEILSVMVVPRDSRGVWDDGKATIYPCAATRGNCSFRQKSPLIVPREFGLAIRTFDRLNDQPNKCGVFEIRLYADSELVFHQRMDKLDFSTKSHMNAHAVYPAFIHQKANFQRCFVLPNDHLDIYIKPCSGFRWEAGKHAMRYEVEDVAGNVSSLDFEVLVKDDAGPDPSKVEGTWFGFDTVNAFRAPNCTVFVPEGRLFDDMDFICHEGARLPDAQSASHLVGNPDVPLANSYLLKIKMDDVDTTLRPYLTVCSLDDKNQISQSLGGNFKYGWMECRPKSFGKFAVFIDSVPPTIKTVDFRRDMQNFRDFSFEITDDLSGIAHYRASIDGRWCLMSYHPRKNRITYVFDDEKVKPGKHLFVLEVEDERGNVATFESEFDR